MPTSFEPWTRRSPWSWVYERTASGELPANLKTGLPDNHRPRTIVISDRSVLGNEPKAVLDGGRVNQAIGGISWKRGGQGDGGVRDRRGHADRSQLRGEALQPGSDRDVEDDPLVPRKPCQLVPGDRRHDELVRLLEGPCAPVADPLRLRRPPVDHMGVEQNCVHACEAFQVSPVENNWPSSTAVIADALERALERARAGRGHQTGDRTAVPGDLDLLAGGGGVQEAKDRCLRVE